MPESCCPKFTNSCCGNGHPTLIRQTLAGGYGGLYGLAFGALAYGGYGGYFGGFYPPMTYNAGSVKFHYR